MKGKYDVIVIGAGIGGIVSGCYLARAGLRTLIVEKHLVPGGCCTSFKRKEYLFDVGPHYLSSLRKNGILWKILSDFNLNEKMEFVASNPVDRIIIPENTINIWKEKEKTRKELVSLFPNERSGIELLFDLLAKDFLTISLKTRNLTYRYLLDNLFKNENLKSLLAVPLGNLGLSSNNASAFAASVILKEFVFDGGYYPKGGMQTFVNKLSKAFEGYGGEIILGVKVDKILIKENKVQGVVANGELYKSKYVISNMDASSTFNDLIEKESLEKNKIRRLKKSVSAIVAYMGINKDVSKTLKHFVTWYYSTNNIDECYKNHFRGIQSKLKYVVCSYASLVDKSVAPKDKSTVKLFALAEYEKNINENEYKKDVEYKLIEMGKKILSIKKDDIEVLEVGIPQTFEKYTANSNGAIYGWSSIIGQVSRDTFPNATSIINLYLAGHWVTNGVGQSGVPVVAYSGANAAKLILKNMGKL